MNVLGAGVALLVLAGCTPPIAQSETPASLLRSVDASDGINRAEAESIAEAYFLKHVGCGVYTGLASGPDSWIVKGKHGFAGDPIKGFLIDKQSGAIRSPVGPSYVRPEAML